MSLKERITDDMKTAMKAKDAPRLAAIRLLLAAIKQKEVDEQIALDEAGIGAVIDKMLKQRKDSITQYEAAGRQDLADGEKAEVEVLTAYKPAGLSDAEVATAVDKAIADSGAASAADMGKVMAVLKPLLAGKADMAEVSKLVKAKLQ